MAWVAAAQLLSHLLICARPETGQIRSHLDRSLIWREQMEHERNTATGNYRPGSHSKEVLQTGGYPGLFADFVFDPHIASAGYRHSLGAIVCNNLNCSPLRPC